jgi:hypothetical protein
MMMVPITSQFYASPIGIMNSAYSDPFCVDFEGLYRIDRISPQVS